MKPSISCSAWTYQRIPHSVGIEVSDWLGTRSPSLTPHLHDEAQVSVVYRGCRRFQIGSATVNVPAGVPHGSVGLGGIVTRSRDIFLTQDFAQSIETSALLLGQLPRCQDEAATVDTLFGAIDFNNLASQAIPLQENLRPETLEAVRGTLAPIADIARAYGLSREGFIRQFSREVGMTPLAYRLAHKATLARPWRR